jgi:hypothetical protein
MKGSAFVFINLVQAVRFGHVGWGFALDEAHTLFYFGSSDHLYRHRWWDLPAWIRYSKVEPKGDIDWWSAIGSKADMLRIMANGDPTRYHIRYHLVKEIEVDNALPEDGRQTAEDLRAGGWAVLSNNCVHQAYDVLTRYGAELPNPDVPLTNLVPKVWFGKIAGRQYNI